MRWTGAVAAAVTVLTAVVAVPTSAQASCAYDPSASSLKQRARGADAVFVATVTSGAGSRVDVAVSDVYKGHVPSRLVLDGGAAATSGHPRFRASTQYLVVAKRRGAVYTTDACLATVPVSDAVISAAEAAFGLPTSLRPAAPQATATPVTTPPNTPSSSGVTTTRPSVAAANTSGHPVRTAVVGLVVGAALVGCFFLPRLRRRRRASRAEPHAGTAGTD